jgi:predicted acetyltransferase
MFGLNLLFVPTEQLSSAQKLRIKELQKECFSHVSRRNIEEFFIAESFGWIFAYENARIVAQVELYSRNVAFEGKSIRLGGIGGTCVTTSKRNRGTATRIVEEGLKILRHMKCDVACLNADVKNHPDGAVPLARL